MMFKKKLTRTDTRVTENGAFLESGVTDAVRTASCSSIALFSGVLLVITASGQDKSLRKSARGKNARYSPLQAVLVADSGSKPGLHWQRALQLAPASHCSPESRTRFPQGLAEGG